MSRRGGMATEDFVLKYRGEAVDEGRMAVRDLAPALIALGDLFHAAKDIADPDSPPVNLEVRAFRRGSFEAALSVSTQDVINFLNQDAVGALATLITLVSDPAQGVFAALRAIRGRFTRRDNADGTTTITTESGDVYNFPQATVNIIQNQAAREAASAATEPVRHEGIDEMRIEREGHDPLVVTKDEVATIEAELPEPGDDEEPLIDQEMEILVTPISISFKDTNKWRLDIGDQKVISASIEDQAFLDRIHRREVAFVEGDTMLVRMRMKQWADMRTRWAVVRVIRHHHRAGRDVPLPFDNDE